MTPTVCLPGRFPSIPDHGHVANFSSAVRLEQDLFSRQCRGQSSSASDTISRLSTRPPSACGGRVFFHRSPFMSDLILALHAYPGILQTSGVLGSVLYIGGFALLQTGRICGNGPIYSCNQLTAASLVLISLIGAFNLGAFLVQVGFLTFGTYGLIRQLKMRRRGVFPEGTGIIRSASNVPTVPALPDGSPETCDWENHPPGPGGGRPVPPCPAVAAPAP